MSLCIYGGPDISPLDNSPPDNSPSQLGQFPPYRSKPNLKITYIHTYMHMCIHIYKYYTYMHIHIDACTHVYMHTIHTCMHTYKYSRIHIHLNTVIYIDIFWHNYTYMYTYIHI